MILKDLYSIKLILYTLFNTYNKNTLNSKDFFQPYIEPEIGIRIKEDINISKAPFHFNKINDLFDGILCSIEIVEFRVILVVIYLL